MLLAAGIPVFAESEPLEDGIYSAIFTTDSSMFNLCETSEGRGTLTVKDGKMVIHITLSSKNHLHLFRGSAEDAQKEGAELLDPAIDKVVYSDGFADDQYDPCIPYDTIMPIIKKSGYDGYLIAEYEGHHFTIDEDDSVQLHRYWSMVKRMYDNA